MTERGVVISSTVSVAPGRFTFKGGVDAQELKRLTLYWERIAYATIGSIGPNLDAQPDLQFLHRHGILSIEQVNMRVEGIQFPPDAGGGTMGGLPLKYYRDVQLDAQMYLADVKTQAGGVWAVAQFGEDLTLSRLQAQAKNLWEFKLYQCFPVPGPDASIQDILEFKEKHGRQFSELQFAVEEMRTSILTSSDPQRQFNICSEKIAFAVSEITRSLERAKLPFLLETLKAFFTARESYLLSASLGALGAAGLSAPLGLGAAAGVALNAGLSLASHVVAGGNKIPEGLKNFAYVYQAKKMFGRNESSNASGNET